MTDIKKILIASICVVLAVAIAAGVSIGVLAGTVNGMKDQIAELNQTVDALESQNSAMKAEIEEAAKNNEDLVSAAEFDAKLAAALGEQNQTMQALISTAVKNQIEDLETEGLTEAQVQTIIDAAVANCLTEADIDAIVAGVDAGLTKDEVKKIVADYTVGYLTYGQIVNLIDNADYDLKAYLEAKIAAVVDAVEDLGGEIADLEDVLESVEGEVDALRTTATPATIGDVIKNARPGDTVTLTAGDYETLTLSAELEDVTIDFTNADVDRIVIGADSVLKNVTISGVDATATGTEGWASAAFIQMASGAQVENLVIEDSVFAKGDKNRNVAINTGVEASVSFVDCTFDSLNYVAYSYANNTDISFEGCTFEGMDSWVLMANGSPFNANLYINNCTFIECNDGIAKTNGKMAAGNTFTFTNNTITNCAGHDGSDAKWFSFTLESGATAVVSGNTKDGADWTPNSANGLVVE